MLDRSSSYFIVDKTAHKRIAEKSIRWQKHSVTSEKLNASDRHLAVAVFISVGHAQEHRKNDDPEVVPNTSLSLNTQTQPGMMRKFAPFGHIYIIQ